MTKWIYISIFFLLMFYFIGFHNSDSCHNYMNIDSNLVENGLLYKEVSLNECYIRGEIMQLASFLLLACIFIIYGSKNEDHECKYTEEKK